MKLRARLQLDSGAQLSLSVDDAGQLGYSDVRSLREGYIV
jgi:hypothetical protein